MGYTADTSGFPYWRDSSMLLGVNSKNQEKMVEDWEKLIDENKKLKEEVELYTNGMSLEEWHDDMEQQKAEITDDAERDIARLKNDNQFYLKRLTKKDKKIKGMEEEIKKLKDRLHWKDQEIKGYQKGALNHGQIALDREEKIKELKEDLDEKVHWQQTMVAYMDYGDHWCHFDRWFGETIDEDDKKQEWVKMWMENTEEEDSDEEEDPDCCESCGKKFDLAYTMNHCEPKLREKYDKYMGSPEDDGDMCPICMDSEN